MSLKQKLVSDGDFRYQLGGTTSLGWTVSLLGYLSTVIGYGNGLITRLVAESQSLSSLGGVLFVPTFGLDRLQNSILNEEE